MRGALQFFACLVLIGLPARATSVRAPDFDTLVDRADLIFTGRVVSQRAEWSSLGGRRSIVTFVSFAVEKVHKGKADSVLALQFLGGTVGDVTMHVAEMPSFKTGERAVLFVENNGLAASPVVGFFHGRFPLRRNAGSHDEVLKHNGELLADVAEIGRVQRSTGTRAASHALSHDEFSARIRQRLARSPGPQP
jgi:hypothetical protein